MDLNIFEGIRLSGMINFFIIINGSNDLYYSMNETAIELIENINDINDVEIYIFYNLVNCDQLNMWTKVAGMEYNINNIGAFKKVNGIIEYIDTKDFFRDVVLENRRVKVMAPDLFLDKYLSTENNNVVILGGHGGPFQCFLDMSTSPSQSINTVKLCNRIKKYKIDLLYLDMCAMNYIEVIYELLYDSKIKNIITYKNLAPFNGVSYFKLIEIFQQDDDISVNCIKILNLIEYPLIYVSSNNLNKFNELKKIQSNLAKCSILETNPEFDSKITEFRNCIKKSVIENIQASNMNISPLNFMKYYLSDDGERKLYTQYNYAKDNLWEYFITRDIKFNTTYNPEAIVLERSSLENIIWLHNTTLNKMEIEDKLVKLIRERGEEFDCYSK